MRIEKIELIDGIYHMTKKPNWILRLFGKKSYVEKYKQMGEFEYFNLKAFCDSNGKIASPISEECKALNKFLRRF